MTDILKQEAEEAGVRALSLKDQVRSIAYGQAGDFILEEMINQVYQDGELLYTIDQEKERLEKILRYIRKGEEKEALYEEDIMFMLNHFNEEVRGAQKRGELPS